MASGQSSFVLNYESLFRKYDGGGLTDGRRHELLLSIDSEGELTKTLDEVFESTSENLDFRVDALRNQHTVYEDKVPLFNQYNLLGKDAITTQLAPQIESFKQLNLEAEKRLFKTDLELAKFNAKMEETENITDLAQIDSISVADASVTAGIIPPGSPFDRQTSSAQSASLYERKIAFEKAKLNDAFQRVEDRLFKNISGSEEDPVFASPQEMVSLFRYTEKLLDYAKLHQNHLGESAGVDLLRIARATRLYAEGKVSILPLFIGDTEAGYVKYHRGPQPGIDAIEHSDWALHTFSNRVALQRLAYSFIRDQWEVFKIADKEGRKLILEVGLFSPAGMAGERFGQRLMLNDFSEIADQGISTERMLALAERLIPAFSNNGDLPSLIARSMPDTTGALLIAKKIGVSKYWGWSYGHDSINQTIGCTTFLSAVVGGIVKHRLTDAKWRKVKNAINIVSSNVDLSDPDWTTNPLEHVKLTGIQYALTSVSDLGSSVSELSEVRKGDFVQYWEWSSSRNKWVGHAAIVDEITIFTLDDGTVEYRATLFGSHESTNGIATTNFGVEGGLNLGKPTRKVFVVRLEKSSP